MPRPPSPIEIDPRALTVLREKDGQSKTGLAQAAGISIGYLHDLETGRRKGNPGVIAALADALQVPKSMISKRRDWDEAS